MSEHKFNILHIAKLARLHLSPQEETELGQAIEGILKTVDQLQQVDTTGVEPLHNPLEDIQPLRADQVTEVNEREVFQKLAPSVEAGLYLVPQVIENKKS